MGKTVAKIDGGSMGEVCENNMLKLVNLGFNSVVNAFVAVAQQVAPPGTNDIGITLAMNVVEI